MNLKIKLNKKLVESLTREILAEQESGLSPEVKALVDKMADKLDEAEKTEMNEGFEEYSELVAQILGGAYGTAMAVYFGSLIAMAFKKGGKEEFQKAMKELEKQHRGGSLGGN